jgi:type I restriction enzyme S subunit
VPPLDEYLWTWFQGLELEGLADGSNVPQINHGDVAPLPVPLPPLDEQHRLVAEAERLLSIAATASDLSRNAWTKAGRLRQSVLRWAFEGKLVDQESNDEPASVLLDRIRTEREVTAPTRRPREPRTRKSA